MEVGGTKTLDEDEDMTQRARDAINGFYALLIWFIENAIQQIRNTKAYFLTWTNIDFMFLVLYLVLFLCIFRVTLPSCVYLAVFLIGSPFSYGESDISIRGKKIILVFLMVFSLLFFIVKYSLPDYSSGKIYRGRYFRKRMHVLYTNDSF